MTATYFPSLVQAGESRLELPDGVEGTLSRRSVPQGSNAWSHEQN